MADKTKKTVELERAVSKSPQKIGSFGFSIMGGAKAKIPAIVCNIEEGGPADMSRKIKIGDQLIQLNDEDLRELEPKELVVRIRGAPSPSAFVFVEDEELRERVHHILRKQEEKRKKDKISTSTSEHSIKSNDKISPSHKRVGHSPNLTVAKEIEIETSVNMERGQSGSGEVVKIRGGKIVSSTLEDSPTLKCNPPPQPSLTGTSTSSEQRNLMNSNSSGSLGVAPEGDKDDDNLPSNLSSEVTAGGRVFVVKQRSHDNFDGLKTATPTQGSPAIRRIPTSTSPGIGRNGVRVSLNEETFVNEITLSQEQTFEMTGNSKTNFDSLKRNDRKFPLPPPPPSGESDRSPQVTRQSSRFKMASPPAPQELIDKYTPRRSPSKLRHDNYSKAITLARQLYMLDGFKKSEIAGKLADMSEFGQMVAKEFLKFFEFEELELDDCLRQFLASFTLSGETQERERVMVHFSQRYFDCNPYSYSSYDVVHGITCALLLLNSDLHTDHGGSKMTFSQFVFSLERIGIKLPKDKLKRMFESIKRKPLESGQDDTEKQQLVDSGEDDTKRVYHVLIPGTFVEVELPESAPVFKDGYISKKNIMEAAHKKVPRGKRQWKPYYAYLKGFLLYLVPPNGRLQLSDTSNALVITHCLAMPAADYHKKSAVLRVTTSDWHAFLLQANHVTEAQQWIVAINKAAAMYSAPPLAAPIGSGAGFQRPTFPLAPTRNSVDQQKEGHELRIKSIQKELEEHQAYKKAATKNKHSAEWFEKLEFLQYENNRFYIYLGSLHSDSVIDFQGPLPTGLVPSPSISTLATSGIADELLGADLRSSPVPQRVPLYGSPLKQNRESSPGDFTTRHHHSGNS